MKYAYTALTLSCLFVGAVTPTPTQSAVSQSVGTALSATASMAVPSPIIDKEGLAELEPIDEIDEVEEEDDEESSGDSHAPVVMDLETKENAYAAAGIIYNKEKDLPVIYQKKALADGSKPSTPQVVACKTEGQIAITYSEGPSDTTARIVRHYNNESIPANFFVSTAWLSQPELSSVLQSVYNAGHLIGMTYRLPTDDPKTMTDDQIREHVIASAKKIEDLIHVAPKYVRLHFSALNDGRSERIMKELGFVLVGYNLDGKDYAYTEPSKVELEYITTFNDYKKAHNDSKGSFVSIQYDIPETSSLDAAPVIIKLIKKEGFTPVRMDGCLNDMKPYKATAAGMEYVSDKFSFGSPGYPSGQNSTAETSQVAKKPVEKAKASETPKEPTQQSAAGIVYPTINYMLLPVFGYLMHYFQNLL